MGNQNTDSSSVAHELLIEYAFKRTQGVFNKFLTPYPIQGLHYEYGFKITNIGSSDFPGGNLNNVQVKFLSTETALISPNAHLIPPLLPKKSIVVYTNNTIFDIPGAIWVSCNITSNEGQVKTYQCSRSHQNYVSVNPANKWSNGDYVVPHMEYLQSITNRNVIILTIVTLVVGGAGLLIA